jgi:hypothetical protein
MFRTNHTLRRITGGAAVAVALAALAVPQALAGSGVRDGRSPDTKDAARAVQQPGSTRGFAGSAYGPPDGWYGYAVELTKAAASSPVTDGRSPDTRDAAVLAHTPVTTITRSPGFEWGDFGIGVAAALGAMLVLVASTKLLAARHGRKQPSPVATA